MPSQAELKKRRVKAAKQEIRQEVVVDRRDRRRRLMIGGFVGLLALALIAPLVGGIFLAGNDDPTIVETTPTIPLVPAEEFVEPQLVDEAFAGAAITGPTPCPDADGSSERTTSFEQAPEGCIDLGLGYTGTLATPEGDLEIELDPSAAPIASNLFVSLARYGVYENAPITLFEGITIIGGFGNPGFTVDATEPPADGDYPIGSIALLAELDGTLNGQIVIVSNAAGAAALAAEPTSPIIGQVTGGLNAINLLNERQIEDPTTQFRVATATVIEAAG